MKLSKNRNVKIISRPCWCPHQHAHAGHATQSLPQFIARNEAISRNECLHAGTPQKASRTEPRSAPFLRAHLPSVLVSSPTRSRSASNTDAHADYSE